MKTSALPVCRSSSLLKRRWRPSQETAGKGPLNDPAFGDGAEAWLVAEVGGNIGNITPELAKQGVDHLQPYPLFLGHPGDERARVALIRPNASSAGKGVAHRLEEPLPALPVLMQATSRPKNRMAQRIHCARASKRLCSQCDLNPNNVSKRCARLSITTQ
jgi:hypothetical protein